MIANGALQLVTGSPANGGNIIIPEHFKAAALAEAEKVRHGLCKKLTSLRVVINLSDKYLMVIKCYGKLWSANYPIARHIVQPLSIFFLFSMPLVSPIYKIFNICQYH